MKNITIFSTLYLGLIDEQYYPEILNYDWNSINFFKELIVYQNNLINKKKKIFRFNYTSKLLKELELLRILGILKSYHRNRIWKLENFLDKTYNLNKLIARINRSEEYFLLSLRSVLISHGNYLINDFNFRPQIYKKIKMNININKINENHNLIRYEGFLFFRLFAMVKSCFITSLDQMFIIKLITNLTFCMNYHSLAYLIYSKILCLV